MPGPLTASVSCVADNVTRELRDGGGDPALIDGAEPKLPRHLTGTLARRHDIVLGGDRQPSLSGRHEDLLICRTLRCRTTDRRTLACSSH